MSLGKRRGHFSGNRTMVGRPAYFGPISHPVLLLGRLANEQEVVGGEQRHRGAEQLD